MAGKTVYAQQNDNLDRIAYRYFPNQQGILEQLLLLNPQLAKQPILPLGTAVQLPSQDEIKPNMDKAIIQLWD